jgi:hypothetical protein
MSAVTETATARWLPRWTPYLVLLIPLAVALWTLRAVLQNYTPAPFFDYWENFYWWRHLVENGRLPDGFFFSQHNEHRILLPRLVYFADIKWFGGTNILPHLGTAAVQLAAAALFIKAAGLRSLRWPGLLGLTASLCLVLWAAQWENLLWPFQIQFVAVYAAGAWAIHLFSLAAADRDRLRLDVMADLQHGERGVRRRGDGAGRRLRPSGLAGGSGGRSRHGGPADGLPDRL